MNNVILITGGSGFIGRALIEFLLTKKQYKLRALVRGGNTMLNNRVQCYAYEDLDNEDLLPEIFSDVDVVVHLAGKAHVAERNTDASFHEYRRVNVALPLRLANLSGRFGVRRFIYLSSIKVNGNYSPESGKPFCSKDLPMPLGPYAISKYEAEVKLKRECFQSQIGLVIIRPPLVYGPGVGANFKEMIRLIKHKVPLPLSSVTTQRSMVFIDNLIDLIYLCLSHPNAEKQPILVSDGNDFELNYLLKQIASILQVPSRLFYVPIPILRWAFFCIGAKNFSEKFLLPLKVDISETRLHLNWHPKISMIDALAKTILDSD